jgi:hypothetical protein
MRLRRTKFELLPVLAWYQRQSGRDRYRTAALLRQDDEWLVVGLVSEFRGEFKITTHHRLEDARAAIVRWVGGGEYEVTADLVPGQIWEQINQLRLTGKLEGDPFGIPTHPM